MSLSQIEFLTSAASNPLGSAAAIVIIIKYMSWAVWKLTFIGVPSSTESSSWLLLKDTLPSTKHRRDCMAI